MSESKAVFLSYASEDASATQRIADALREAGVTVWFDKNELRGGDAWDASIRRQIRECALFVPVISASTEAREEGYFRREWNLAAERTLDMGQNRTFVVPVVIDQTHQKGANVPDKFRTVQWTRLADGCASRAFVARVQSLLGESTQPGASEPKLESAPPKRAAPAAPRRSVLITAATALAVLIVSAGVWYVLQARKQEVAAPPVFVDKSIAVLPFVDMSEKKDQEYFSDGLSNELIDQLAKVPQLHVIARTSSFSFKNKPDDIPTIARKLNVANILEGSVRKSGLRLRVTTELIQADSGRNIWSETYDQELKDVFRVQDEIAAAVVTALKIHLLPSQQVPSSHRTNNLEAYNQFLLGQQFADRANLDDWGHAINDFKKAVALDPGFAAAYAEYSVTEAWLVDQTGGNRAGFDHAMALAEKAVALAPDQPEGYRARAHSRTVDWNWAGAEADLQKALNLDAGDSRTQGLYADLQLTLGRGAEAIAAATKATELDPLSSFAWRELTWVSLNAGKLDVAMDAVAHALDIAPSAYFSKMHLGDIQVLEGKASEAAATCPTIQNEFWRLVCTAMAEHSLGHASQSQLALKELIAKHAKGGAFQIADVYAWRGENDKAFEWLDRAFRQHDTGFAYFKLDAFLARLHGDPRFGALLRKLNLPE